MNLSLPLTKGESVRIYTGAHDFIEEKLKIYIPNTSKKINILALALKGNTDLETAKNIRKYIFDNYKYNLETEEIITYITNFLVYTKEGFCVHFTRSCILLAQLNAIVARQISGYIVDITSPNNEDEFYGYNRTNSETIITGKDTHLWSEVYINNK